MEREGEITLELFLPSADGLATVKENLPAGEHLFFLLNGALLAEQEGHGGGRPSK